jgi:CRISPR-associated endonuclease/helicase Cas3
MSAISFEQWFATLTGHGSPHPWQQQLANETICRNRLLRISTGLGKTEGVLTAWVYNRVVRNDDCWPRRLVWCLPMRVLVEQTQHVAQTIAQHLTECERLNVSVLMGGEDAGEWFLYPEESAIVIGTQDMLLSRALNWGYSSGRARWPVEFGLLSHDALWVMDEVQLMDVGLATSAQLQAFRDKDQDKHLRPCHTWWMSATLQPEWLRSVDTAAVYDEWIKAPCVIPPKARRGGVWEVSKSIERSKSSASTTP